MMMPIFTKEFQTNKIWWDEWHFSFIFYFLFCFHPLVVPSKRNWIHNNCVYVMCVCVWIQFTLHQSSAFWLHESSYGFLDHVRLQSLFHLKYSFKSNSLRYIFLFRWLILFFDFRTPYIRFFDFISAYTNSLTRTITNCDSFQFIFIVNFYFNKKATLTGSCFLGWWLPLCFNVVVAAASGFFLSSFQLYAILLFSSSSSITLFMSKTCAYVSVSLALSFFFTSIFA